jgi:hypothetical protein
VVAWRFTKQANAAGSFRGSPEICKTGQRGGTVSRLPDVLQNRLMRRNCIVVAESFAKQANEAPWLCGFLEFGKPTQQNLHGTKRAAKQFPNGWQKVKPNSKPRGSSLENGKKGGRTPKNRIVVLSGVCKTGQRNRTISCLSGVWQERSTQQNLRGAKRTAKRFD